MLHIADDDSRHVALYASGVESAFRILFDRYQKLLGQIVMRLGLSSEDARDVVQQTFLQLHRARNDWSPTQPVRPWLITVARNEAISQLRRRGHRVAETVREELDDARGADELLVQAQDIIAMQSNLAKLAPTLRCVLELHFFDGLAFADVALALGISESAAKVRAHRGYQQLRAHMLTNHLA